MTWSATFEWLFTETAQIASVLITSSAAFVGLCAWLSSMFGCYASLSCTFESCCVWYNVCAACQWLLLEFSSFSSLFRCYRLSSAPSATDSRWPFTFVEHHVVRLRCSPNNTNHHLKDRPCSRPKYVSLAWLTRLLEGFFLIIGIPCSSIFMRMLTMAQVSDNLI